MKLVEHLGNDQGEGRRGYFDKQALAKAEVA